MAKPAPTIEEGLGPYLRREREERGISIREVSDQTRIRTFYLERIETGEYDRLPAIPIARGFVRAYATSIGVDSDSAARQFDREVAHRLEEAKEPALSERIAFSDIAPRRGGQMLFVSVAAVACFLLVSGVLLWFLRGKTERLVPLAGLAERVKAAAGPAIGQLPQMWNREASPQGAPRAGAAAPARRPAAGGSGSNGGVTGKGSPPEGGAALPSPGPGGREKAVSALSSAPLESQAQSPPPAAPAGPSVEASPVPSPVEGRLALRVLALEDTWVRIVVDQKETQELLLMAGNEKNWRGAERFILTVGNVSGTQVSLNGAKISLPQTSSNIVRDFVITEKLLN